MVKLGCQCSYTGAHACKGAAAPVAFLVDRNGKRLELCTYCDLSKDKTIAVFPTKDELSVFHEYDALGGECLEYKYIDQYPNISEVENGSTSIVA